MKKLRWQLVIILLTGVVVGVLLLGQQPAAQQAANNSPAPASGGIYTEALTGHFQRLNPILDFYNSPDRDIDRLLFGSLVKFDTRGLAVADLAESWGLSQDGTLYNFSLRPNLVWQDGKPLTSDDVIFTVDLLRSDSSLIPDDVRNFWKDVEAVRLNDTNLQFRLPEPFAPFLDYLTFGILPKHLLEGVSVDQMPDNAFSLKPVGSGPYRLDHLIIENNQVEGVSLASNDKYYAGKPFIDQIIFRYYSDPPSALLAYKAGEVQGIGTVTQDILPQVLAEPGLLVYSARQPNLTMVYLNTQSTDAPYLGDPELRRALMIGLNRQRMINSILKGQATLAVGPVMPGTWAFYDGLETLDYDLAGAKLVLQKAGYTRPDSGGTLQTKDNIAVKLQLLYPDDPVHAAMAESIERDWSALGIEVDLQAKSYEEVILDRLPQHTYQTALVEINQSRSPDPDPYPFWDKSQIGNGQNYAQWDNKAASEAIEQARITIDSGDRTRYYHNFQVIFMKDMPSLPLFYPVYSYAIDKQVQGVRLGPILEPGDRFSNLMEWFLVTTRKTAEPAGASQTLPAANPTGEATATIPHPPTATPAP
jgi:peptide/nickel transport system substrate-binding protein